MAGRWIYTLGADGIVTVGFELQLNPGATDIDDAMARLAAAAKAEAAAPRTRRHGEPS